MANKIKDKAAIAARKRERKANSLAFGEKDYIPALIPIEEIPTKKIVTVGYKDFGKTTIYDGSKCPVTAELERTAISIAIDKDFIKNNSFQQFHFDSYKEYENALKYALEKESFYTLTSLWKHLDSFEHLPTMFKTIFESIEFVVNQLTTDRISWRNVKVFFNNHYNLGIKI